MNKTVVKMLKKKQICQILTSYVTQMVFCERKEPVTTIVLSELVKRKKDYQTTNLKCLINLFGRKNVVCGSLGC